MNGFDCDKSTVRRSPGNVCSFLWGPHWAFHISTNRIPIKSEPARTLVWTFKGRARLRMYLPEEGNDRVLAQL